MTNEKEMTIKIDNAAEVPNAETIQAFEEGQKIVSDGNAPRYKTIEELKAALANKE